MRSSPTFRWAHTLPVPAIQNDTTSRAHDGTEQHVHSLGPELAAHAQPPLASEHLVPAGADMNAARPDANKVGAPEAVAGIAQTHAREPEAGDGRDETGAACVGADATGQADLCIAVSII
jgi:hypothetical protein